MWGSHTINKFFGEHCLDRRFQAKLFDACIRESDIEGCLHWPDLASGERVNQYAQPFFSRLRCIDFEQNVTGSFESAITSYDKPLDVLKIESVCHMHIPFYNSRSHSSASVSLRLR